MSGSIGIIDYGMGNLHSVSNAIEYLGGTPELCRDPRSILNYTRLILPGVGAFPDCMAALQSRKLIDPLNEAVIARKTPILGICLGMQVMATRGLEGRPTEGLGWIDGDVTRITTRTESFRIPHIGWNSIDFDQTNPLFKGIALGSDVYFVHSYHMQCRNSVDLCATTEHGGTITAAVRHDNIYGVQFHPEKSQDVGLAILQNFLSV